MPTIADIFAHIFNYSDHIATVHSHNGKSHVHYEYIEAAKKSSHGDPSSNNLPKKSESSSEHILFTTAPDISTTAAPLINFNTFFQNLPVIFLQGNFRPPISFHA